MFTEAKLFHKAGEGSGGDSHNLGWYATKNDLETAHATAQAGDWAIVGATDTVWVWDTDTSGWVDTDQKGQVTSVNNQTGAVTIGANDVLPSQTGYSGRVLGTDGFVAGWVKPEIVQRSTMPVASQEEEGKVYQFVGVTDANYTHGYFYECVSDGLNPATYSWSQTNVQPAGGSSLPSQTGNNGKFLTTDGTDASWASAMAQFTTMPTAGASYWSQTVEYIGSTTATYVEGSFYKCVKTSVTYTGTTSFSPASVSSATVTCSASDLGQLFISKNVDPLDVVSGTIAYSSDWYYTVTAKNANGDTLFSSNFLRTKLTNDFHMSFSSNLTSGDVVDYTCAISEDTVTYGWVQTGELPSQSGQSGKFLTTNGSKVSWAAAVQNTATGADSLTILGTVATISSGINVGVNSSVEASNGVAIGAAARAYGDAYIGRPAGVAVGGGSTAGYSGCPYPSIAIGPNAAAVGAGCIQFNTTYASSVNGDAGTFKVANSNGNFEIMSSDGTIPAARHATLPAADGTYTLQLVITSGVPTLSWVAV